MRDVILMSSKTNLSQSNNTQLMRSANHTHTHTGSHKLKLSQEQADAPPLKIGSSIIFKTVYMLRVCMLCIYMCVCVCREMY